MTENRNIAQAYYTAMGQKDLTALACYLHPNVQLVGPLSKLNGKEAVLASIQQFMQVFNSLTIPACFGSETQAMVAYELNFPAPIGIFRSAALLTLQDKLITRIELFFDARPFEKM